jgi:hypothetical protein
MAQRVNVVLIDDLDGSEAEETIRFAFEGTEYEIDLNKKNAKGLRDAVSKYLSAARKTGRGRGRARRGAGAASRPSREYDPKEVRSWAESQGIEVSQRGRVPADLVARFQEAHR